MNFTCIYICIYSPSNGFTDPILTKLLPSLHPAALISDQYPALCRLPYIPVTPFPMILTRWYLQVIRRGRSDVRYRHIYMFYALYALK